MTRRGELTLGGVTYKFAGGLEEKNLKHLHEHGAEFEYEPGIIRYPVPAKKAWYKPDLLLKNGIIVETKGQFMSKDRQKHVNVKAEYPDLDLRFVFSNPNAKIGSKSKTTYAMWCDYNGFKYAAKTIPLEWIKEPLDKKRMKAAQAAISKK